MLFNFNCFDNNFLFVVNIISYQNNPFVYQFISKARHRSFHLIAFLRRPRVSFITEHSTLIYYFHFLFSLNIQGGLMKKVSHEVFFKFLS